MDNKNQGHNGFSYTYSAKEQAEIMKIREKYTPAAETEDKMEQLRRLDANVSNTAQATAIAVGITGTLAFGLGMSLCMSKLGELLGDVALVCGIITGIVGCIIASLAYPTYNLIIKHKRKKIAPQIIRLTDELMK